ncbi:hypothetical protein HAX54_000110 [Datura stramonium]|uniref:RRM domain-containing protein n=1 Tax=Datura stramonium TaxID=4076 RepID=A0ABS8RJV2_DATST|nr:hypothetical protein [Datura stramonium]
METRRTCRHFTETVARVFIYNYYNILQKQIDHSYQFYKEKSVLSWPLSNGEIKSVTTYEGIKEFIISSHFKDNKVEVVTIDSQSSIAGGILVVDTGYYVLNDIFRFIRVEKSSAVVDEKVDENASVDPLVVESKVEDVVKEVSDKSKTKVTIDDQVGQKSSTNKKEKSVAKTAPVVENEALMMKQGRSSPTMNVPYNIVRVVADDGVPSSLKNPQAKSLVHALKSNLSDVSKVIAPSINVPQDNCYDDIQYKSIYIEGLPINTTISDLYDVVKVFGPVPVGGIDAHCCGLVYFQHAKSAQNAVQVATRGHTFHRREVNFAVVVLNRKARL